MGNAQVPRRPTRALVDELGVSPFAARFLEPEPVTEFGDRASREKRARARHGRNRCRADVGQGAGVARGARGCTVGQGRRDYVPRQLRGDGWLLRLYLMADLHNATHTPRGL